MSMFRMQAFSVLTVVILALAVPSLRADAQAEAEVLMARVRAAYADTPSLEVEAKVRELRLSGAGAEDEPRVVMAVYQRVIVTKGLGDRWRIVSQRERDFGGNTTPERTVVLGKAGDGDGEMMLMSAATNQAVRAPIPAALFRQETIERMGTFARLDPVFSAMFMNRGEEGAEAFGFERLEVVGRTVFGGREVMRVKASRSGGGTVLVWVDEATGTLLRVVEMNVMVGQEGGPRPLRETLYAHDFGRGQETGHFDLEAGWSEARPGIAAEAGFGDVAELQAAASGQDGGAGGEPGFGPSRRSTPGGLAERGAASAMAGEQPDVSGQMASIVMVEGDKGVGTGFVARLRGVDFVVTNLHVIGGNERLRVTTVGGADIPVAGMFGAQGRDIAILRIQGNNTVPPLTLAQDPLKTVRLGDRVMVVGNRRGGGVATRVTGTVRGIGPNRVEVDAPFEPGNSGSPILHVATGEVIGVATFSQTRELDELDETSGTQGRMRTGVPKKTEQRWFGFRMDGVEKWEAIELTRWRAQAERLVAFEADSEAIYYALNGRFKEAMTNPRVRPLIDRFLERYERMGSSPVVAGQEVQEFFQGLRSLAGSGVKELSSGDYYDFFRTSEYWETSIPQQLKARAELQKRLDRASENSALFLSRLRR